MSAFLEVDLKKLRIQRGERLVLDGLNWKIRSGERWVLIGGNGAGKTQLLKALAGNVWPAAGIGSRQYRWRGETFSTPNGILEEIGYVGAERQDRYERYGWDHRVESIVGTGLYRTDIPLNELTDRDRLRIANLLKKLKITHLARRRFLSLSYGERRLTLLARALAAKPKLLLLDELFNGLDAENRSRVLQWLNGTSRTRMPWVLATHRAEDIPRTATHALIIDGGRVIYRGSLKRAPMDRWVAAPRPPSNRPTPLASTNKPRRSRSTALLVKLDHASVHLDGAHIIHDLSLEIRAGECWVVHGPNGSGKSTLLRALYGDHAIEGGVKRFDVEPGVPLEIFKKQVGWIAPHLQADYPLELTVAEAVQSGRYASIGLNDPPTATDVKAATKALEFFGLDALAARTLRELSYGQLRRVLFARAWTRKTRLLLLDEPFSGVDAQTRTMLLGHIETLIRQGTAVVIATHHDNEWPAGTTHELALRQGCPVNCGPVRRADFAQNGPSSRILRRGKASGL